MRSFQVWWHKCISMKPALPERFCEFCVHFEERQKVISQIAVIWVNNLYFRSHLSLNWKSGAVPALSNTFASSAG